MQAPVDRHHQFVDNMLTNGKPVKFTQDGRNVIKFPRLVVMRAVASSSLSSDN